jgi:uncharacterized protein YjbI with pentapeptide repeats
MADEEQVKRLYQGVWGWQNSRPTPTKPPQGILEWNKWRTANPEIKVELDNADLSHTNLIGADLRCAKLNLANLECTSLRSAILYGARLVGADLDDADLSNADLRSTRLKSANLTHARLIGADLSPIGADAYLSPIGADPRAPSDLRYGPTFMGANLKDANLRYAKLLDANLMDADLTNANLSCANLRGASLVNATLAGTIFADVDLSGVTGLERCRHTGPSTIDHRTLQKSGPLPITFLRGVGMPDNLIDYLPSLLNQPIQHYSCFISYSSKDDEFAHRIHADLQNNGVRCWFAPHDMPTGAKIWDAIDEAIKLRDKLLHILSEHSIESDWVEDEVQKAFAEERDRKEVVLFPVRVDDAVMETPEPWARKLRDQRNVGDFRRWKDHDAYKQSLARVLRDLTKPQV